MTRHKINEIDKELSNINAFYKDLDLCDELLSKTKTTSPADSAYVRFLELLHLFSTDMTELFKEYLFTYKSINDIDNENIYNIADIKYRFCHDPLRYKTNHKFLEKYFEAFKNYLENRNKTIYNYKIDDYMHELEELVIKSPYNLINDYSCYKIFFTNFFKSINTILDLKFPEDPSYFLITYMQLNQVGISILHHEVIWDLHRDYLQSKHAPLFLEPNKQLIEIIMKDITSYCKYKSSDKVNKSKTVFLDTFVMLRDNWNLFKNLSQDDKLSNFLFDIILNNTIDISTYLFDIRKKLSNINALDVLQRSLDVAYIVNFTPVSNTRVSPSVIISFFEKKSETDLDTVIFCWKHLLPICLIEKHHLEILYFYACSLIEQ